MNVRNLGMNYYQDSTLLVLLWFMTRNCEINEYFFSIAL